jgi:hypothetical protein
VRFLHRHQALGGGNLFACLHFGCPSSCQCTVAAAPAVFSLSATT